MKGNNGEGSGGGGGKWLAVLLLFLGGLILIGGFAYPLLKSRARPAAAPGSDDVHDVHDVILGRLDRLQHDLSRLDQIEGRLTLIEEQQAQMAPTRRRR